MGVMGAAQSIGVNETAQQKAERAGSHPLTFKEELQRKEEEPMKSPEEEWAEG